MTTNLSYIITHRASDPFRHRNLCATIDFLLKHISGIEIIVIEQDKKPSLEFLSKQVKCLFLKNDSLFNRAWGFNVGYRNARNNLIAFGDNDLIVPPESILESCERLSKKDSRNLSSISPYKSGEVFDLNEQESQNFLKNYDFSIPIIPRKRLGPHAGGIIIMTKQLFELVGGWEEEIKGWGGEDDHMTIKLTKLADNMQELDRVAFHLNHENSHLFDTSLLATANPNYLNNLQCIENIRHLSKENLQKQCDEKFAIIGQCP